MSTQNDDLDAEFHLYCMCNKIKDNELDDKIFDFV